MFSSEQRESGQYWAAKSISTDGKINALLSLWDSHSDVAFTSMQTHGCLKNAAGDSDNEVAKYWLLSSGELMLLEYEESDVRSEAALRASGTSITVTENTTDK